MDSKSLTMSIMSRSTARASPEIPIQPSYSAAMQSSIAWQVCIMKSKMWCVFKPSCQFLVSLTEGSNFDHRGCFISWFSISDSLSSHSNQILLRIQTQNRTSYYVLPTNNCDSNVYFMYIIPCVFWRENLASSMFLLHHPSLHLQSKSLIPQSFIGGEITWGTSPPTKREKEDHRLKQYQTEWGYLTSQIIQCGDGVIFSKFQDSKSLLNSIHIFMMQLHPKSETWSDHIRSDGRLFSHESHH